MDSILFEYTPIVSSEVFFVSIPDKNRIPEVLVIHIGRGFYNVIQRVPLRDQSSLVFSAQSR